MKPFIIITLACISLVPEVFSQAACSNLQIESPVVSKPTDGSIVSVTCSTLTVKWKGAADQTYVLKVVSIDPITREAVELPTPTNVSCDNFYNCTVTIPVKANNYLNWSVQAIQLVDNRTFLSYPFRGEQDYQVPACESITSEIKEKESMNAALYEVNEMALAALGRVKIYPNPSKNVLNVNWQGEYKGNAKLMIMDVAGKTIQSQTIEKAALNYNNQLPVSFLKPGAYYLYIKLENGRSLSSKFYKN